jgi:Tol biopolymer transport system component
MTEETILSTSAKKRGFFNLGCLVWLGVFLALAVLLVLAYLFGPAVMGWPQVPNLTLLPEDNATFYLEELGLNYQVFTEETDSPLANGLVIGQEPLPGRYIQPGGTVRISVAIHLVSEIEGQTQPTEAAQAEPSPTAESAAETTPEGAETPAPAVPEVDVQLAFASDRTGVPQIWLSQLSGDNLIQLTEMTGGACQPDWSPDGAQIVFVSPCSGNEETYADSTLWLIRVDGTGLQQLSDGPGDYDPAWSPDGTRIAFTSARDTRTQLYFYTLSDGSIVNYSNNLAFEYQPAWSPDGLELAFVTTTTGSPAIFIRTVADGSTRIFSRDTSTTTAQPAWAADGSRILYNQRLASGLPGLVFATLANEGFNAKPLLTQPSPPMRDGDFSPDGQWLAYEGWPDGVNHDIFIATASGTQEQRITDDAGFDFDPALRP